MQKWEYIELYVIETVDSDGINIADITAWVNDTQAYYKVDPSTRYKYINKLGEEGWEMIAVKNQPLTHIYYFKRPKVG